MMNGDEWYHAEIDQNLLLEAIVLVGLTESNVRISNTSVVDHKTGKILFSGEDIWDLFAEIVSNAGIYIEII